MSETLTSHIQAKIKSLKDEIKGIKYTINDGIIADSDGTRINDCVQKIQVLNEVLCSFEIGNFRKVISRKPRF